MWPILIVLGVMGTVLIVSSKSTNELVAGKSYRFFWRVRPPLDVFAADAVSAALRATGAGSITINQGNGETVGSHSAVAKTSKKIDLGKPLLAAGSSELILTDVKEIS